MSCYHSSAVDWQGLHVLAVCLAHGAFASTRLLRARPCSRVPAQACASQRAFTNSTSVRAPACVYEQGAPDVDSDWPKPRFASTNIQSPPSPPAAAERAMLELRRPTRLRAARHPHVEDCPCHSQQSRLASSSFTRTWATLQVAGNSARRVSTVWTVNCGKRRADARSGSSSSSVCKLPAAMTRVDGRRRGVDSDKYRLLRYSCRDRRIALIVDCERKADHRVVRHDKTPAVKLLLHSGGEVEGQRQRRKGLPPAAGAPRLVAPFHLIIGLHAAQDSFCGEEKVISALPTKLAVFCYRGLIVTPRFKRSGCVLAAIDTTGKLAAANTARKQRYTASSDLPIHRVSPPANCTPATIGSGTRPVGVHVDALSPLLMLARPRVRTASHAPLMRAHACTKSGALAHARAHACSVHRPPIKLRAPCCMLSCRILFVHAASGLGGCLRVHWIRQHAPFHTHVHLYMRDSKRSYESIQAGSKHLDSSREFDSLAQTLSAQLHSCTSVGSHMSASSCVCKFLRTADLGTDAQKFRQACEQTHRGQPVPSAVCMLC
eukprot:6191340-Pleurochrysis_carterae.AAC.4